MRSISRSGNPFHDTFQLSFTNDATTDGQPQRHLVASEHKRTMMRAVVTLLAFVSNAAATCDTDLTALACVQNDVVHTRAHTHTHTSPLAQQCSRGTLLPADPSLAVAAVAPWTAPPMPQATAAQMKVRPR